MIFRVIIASVLLVPIARAQPADAMFADGFEAASYCPPGRIGTTTVNWRYDGFDQRVVDATQAINIWGHNIATAPLVDMPWAQGYAVFWYFPRDGYLAAEFTVPEGLSPDQRGMFSHGETLPGLNVTMAISPKCGDFHPTGAMCLVENVSPGGIMGTWKVPTASAQGCELTPGQTYYANVKFTDPTADSYDCGSTQCRASFQSNHTP
ncbi:hypothetical protein [Dokdonella soli]|uniref:Uncharacterized protein n=1 Tax=Dokdonella soli TaxID=529810 RepID=A0ABN1IJ61_9GAMM